MWQCQFIKFVVGRQKDEQLPQVSGSNSQLYDVVIMRVVVFDEAAGCIPVASVQYT